MNRICWLSFFCTVTLCLPCRAAEKPSPATRAYLYQREARAVLLARGWHLSRDDNGKIVADHPLGMAGAPASGTNQLVLTSRPLPGNSPFHAFAWLTVTFKPESVSRTKCTANIVAYTVWEKMKKGEAKPSPFNNPETTRELQSMMGEAERSLGAKHPEYAAK